MSGTCSFRLCTRPLFRDLETCDKHRVYVAPVKPELETPIKRRIRAAVAAAGCIVWVHDVDNRMMKTGLGIGTADLICVVPPYGRFAGIECKRPKYSPSDVTSAQRCWLAAVRKFGGVSGIATSVEEAMEIIDEARRLP